MNEMILTNHHVEIKKTASELNISHGSMFIIIHNQFGYQKMCAHFAPCLLTNNYKKQIFVYVLSFLKHSHSMVNSFEENHNKRWKLDAPLHFKD